MVYCLKSKQGGESGEGTSEGSAIDNGGGSACGGGGMGSGGGGGGGVDPVAVRVSSSSLRSGRTVRIRRSAGIRARGLSRPRAGRVGDIWQEVLQGTIPLALSISLGLCLGSVSLRASHSTLGSLINLLWGWVWITQAGSLTVNIFRIIFVACLQALINLRAIAAVGIDWGRRGGGGSLSNGTGDESSKEKDGGELHFEGWFDIKQV